MIGTNKNAFIEVEPERGMSIFISSTPEEDKKDLCPDPQIEEALREIRRLNNQPCISLEKAFKELLQEMITTIKRLLQKIFRR